MLDAGLRLRLAEKTFDGQSVVAGDQFDGDRSAQLRIPRLVDDGHAAAPEPLVDAASAPLLELERHASVCAGFIVRVLAEERRFEEGAHLRLAVEQVFRVAAEGRVVAEGRADGRRRAGRRAASGRGSGRL